MSENSTSSTADLMGLDPDSRQMVLETIGQLKKRLLIREKIAEYDREEIFPEDIYDKHRLDQIKSRAQR